MAGKRRSAETVRSVSQIEGPCEMLVAVGTK